ncbi:hypothetical protein KA005_84400 [bacterium]|nr:hypothetical protein [bacterium]
MAIEDLDSDFDVKKATTDMLVAAAKAAHGYVYYESEVAYNGDSRPIRIILYEKHHKPDPKFATILKKQGVEVVVHTRS